MGMWSAHASGISIIIAWGSDRPVARRSSTALSSVAVSLCGPATTGTSFATSSPNSGEENIAWRAAIQLMFPRSVLISPLCIAYL